MSTIKLSPAERTTLSLLYRIMAKIDGNESDNVKAEILERGFTGQYHDVILSTEEYSPEICKETSDILQMYRVINNSLGRLSDEEKAQLDLIRLEFDGFDNHEEHFHYASFMIDKLGLWAEHKDRDIDSHSGMSIIKYRSMLGVYNRYYGNPAYELSFDIIQEIINSI